MKIDFIVAGAGEMYCGACMHDMLLAQGLINKGHEVKLYPLYTPVKVDFELPQKEKKIYFSGINAYLEQNFESFRKRSPGLLDKLLESPSLLKLMMSFSIDIEPAKLGAMTVSVLKGAEGFQKKEVIRLVEAMKKDGKPDIVVITNSMLIGIAPVIEKELGCKIYCQLMGEEDFILHLPAPHAEEAQTLMRRQTKHIQKFLAPSKAYAEEMAYFLAVGKEKMETVTFGINAGYYHPLEKRVTEPFKIGYLSRIMPAKGFDILVDAFILLSKKYGKNAELWTAGITLGARHRRYYMECRKKLLKEGLIGKLVYIGVPGLKEKAEFLKGLSVFSIPSRFSESRGFAVLEAMASGIPVVLPDSGIYREFINKGNAGILVNPNDPESLAKGILNIMDHPSTAETYAKNARNCAKNSYSQERMVEENIKFYEKEMLIK